MPHHFLRELRAAFADRAHHPALTYYGRTYAFCELDTLAKRCAAWLRTLGVSPGDRVALCTPNKLAFVAAHLGTIYAGGVSLPLNPRFTREELRFFLADSESHVVVAGPEQCLLLKDLQQELPQLQNVATDGAA